MPKIGFLSSIRRIAIFFGGVLIGEQIFFLIKNSLRVFGHDWKRGALFLKGDHKNGGLRHFPHLLHSKFTAGQAYTVQLHHNKIFENIHNLRFGHARKPDL